jgi:hypothetical protein
MIRLQDVCGVKMVQVAKLVVEEPIALPLLTATHGANLLDQFVTPVLQRMVVLGVTLQLLVSIQLQRLAKLLFLTLVLTVVLTTIVTHAKMLDVFGVKMGNAIERVTLLAALSSLEANVINIVTFSQAAQLAMLSQVATGARVSMLV